MFQCDKCGECCRNLHRSPAYKDLHDGDGICRYLEDNLCSIYESRPLLCRIQESYDIIFKEKLSYEEYLQLNYEACTELKEQKEG